MKLRSGDHVLVECAIVRGVSVGKRAGIVMDQGRDSGGPWISVVYKDGAVSWCIPTESQS